MSVTADTTPHAPADAAAEPAAVAVPVLVRGWTEGRARRARMFAVLLALVALAALWSAFQPWFSFSTSGQASCQRPSVTSAITVRTPVSNTAVNNVYATGCVSGRDIARESTQAGLAAGLDAASQQALAQLQQTNTTPSPAVMFGLPRPVALVVLFSALGVAALAMRNGVLGVVAILGFYYAHKDLGTFTALMGAGEGGSLNHPLSGFQLFGWALVLGWGLLASATLFIAKHNADQRAIAKRAAIAAGETPPPGLFDHVFAFAGGKIGVALEAAKSHQHAAAE